MSVQACSPLVKLKWFFEYFNKSKLSGLACTNNVSVSDPNTITQQNVDIQFVPPNSNDGNYHNEPEPPFELPGEISHFVDRNVVTISESQLNQIIQSAFHEANASHNNDSMQTEPLTRDCNAPPNSRHSPPPPYDFNPCVQPTPYEQHQILQFPHVQYLQQQRLQYPQQESLQYHEEISHYPQRIQYPYRREGNYPILYEPPIKADNCLRVDTVCCCFCIIPILFLISLLYFASTSDY